MPSIHCYFENKAAAACATSALNIFCSIYTAFRCLHRIWDRPNKIAAALGRSPSSISRELKRNSSKNPKKPTNRANYHHWRAHTLAMMRRRDHRRTALPPESFKRDYVCRGLSLFWSPEQIANRLREDFPGQIVGTSTIYRYLRRAICPAFPAKRISDAVGSAR